MKPQALTVSSFDKYSPSARAVAVEHLEQLKRLPVPVLASFLDRIMGWGWEFPAERYELTGQLRALGLLTPGELRPLLEPFLNISLPSDLEELEWLNAPATFLERLTPYLWSSGQIDKYRLAAKTLIDTLSAHDAAPHADTQRLVIFTCGKDLVAKNYPIFSKLGKHGLQATEVDGDDADEWISGMLARRNARNPAAYAHWFLDGGATRQRKLASEDGVYLSYDQGEPVRSSILKVMEHAVASGWGPELLRSRLAALTPVDCRANTITNDPVLQHFIVDLFANGSGTQIYSTSFVQWSAREILRRAQPETLVVRVTARVRQRSLNEFFAGAQDAPELDYAGSLIDGDLAAYYTWLELQNLPGAPRSVFLTWLAGHRQAFLIGPGVPRNVSTNSTLTLSQVLAFADLTA
jgi:hypothetical protein